MPVLRLFTSNRLEALADELVRVVGKPLCSPLGHEVIVVQSAGMERWLSMELARRRGVWAGARFPFPAAFVAEVLDAVVPDVEASPGFTPEALTWRLMDMLPSLSASRHGFDEVRSYLQGGDDRRLHQLACRIADLFDQYTLYRPSMVLEWQRGDAGDWQGTLWRELSAGREREHRAARWEAALSRLRSAGAVFEGLPERVAVFGVHALPPFHLDVAAALSRHVDVNFFVLCASDSSCPESPDSRSLAASLGRQGRAFLAAAAGLESVIETKRFVPPRPETLLGMLQEDIYLSRRRGGDRAPRGRIAAGDESVVFASCHSPLREMQALRDYLLKSLDADAELQPRDILVVTPDIETYTPYIEAVFSKEADRTTPLPFSIADRNSLRSRAATDLFFKLLGLHGSRLDAPGVLALLDAAPLQRRFKLDAAAIETARSWIKSAGIHWGIDGADRARFGLPAHAESTWRAGIDRILLGQALPEKSTESWRGVFPLDAADAGDSETLGSLLDALDLVFTAARDLEEPRTLAGWADFLSRLLDRSIDPGDEEDDVCRLRLAVAGLHDLGTASGFRQPVGLEPIRDHLARAVEAGASATGFLRGGVTFCQLLPARSIPFAVICLVGMDDGRFPRSDRSISFDLIGHQRQPLDRSLRDEDRDLFLEALVSARRGLYVSFVGQRASDDATVPPSVLVSELLDAIDEGYELDDGRQPREHLIRRHRLHSFHPSYFEACSRLYSFDAESCAASERLLGARSAARAFFTQPLPELPAERREVAIEDLVRFYRNPARAIVIDRLKLRLDDADAEISADEPLDVDIDGLERYKLAEELLQHTLRGRPQQEIEALFRAKGVLPPGAAGAAAFTAITDSATTIAAKLAPLRDPAQERALDVDVAVAGFRVVGRVEGLHRGTLLRWRVATLKAKDRISAWIEHLALGVAGALNHPTIVLASDSSITLEPAADPKGLLSLLLDFYWTGLCRPLPFFPRTSWEYVRALREKSHDQAIRKALQAWGPTERSPGDECDPYVQLCFRDRDPFAGERVDEFAACATAILGPLADHCRENEGDEEMCRE